MKRPRNSARTHFCILLVLYVILYINLNLYNLHSAKIDSFVLYIFQQEEAGFAELEKKLQAFGSNKNSSKEKSSKDLRLKSRDKSKNWVDVSKLDLTLLSQTNCVESAKRFYQVSIFHNAVVDVAEAKYTKNQRSEFFQFDSNFFTVFCRAGTNRQTISRNSYFRATNALKVDFQERTTRTGDNGYEWMLIVVREEYANVYWTIMDVFDIFHIIRSIGAEVQTVWADAHPQANIDQLWEIYFGDVLNLSHIKNSTFKDRPPTLFASNLITRPNRQTSLFKTANQPNLPAFNDFRQEAYKKLKIVAKNKDCSRIRVTVVWRRDYVNHPGNPSGKILRKISNEFEVIEEINKFKTVQIQQASLETLSVAEQIELMSRTDVFFGMHGAGHAMTVFMPRGGAVVEVTTPRKKNNRHMKQVAVSSGHYHITHVLQPSPAEAREDTKYEVKPSVVQTVIKQALFYLCN